MNNINISIAGFHICLTAGGNSKISIDEGFQPFVVKDYCVCQDISIICYAGIPENFLSDAKCLFEAKNEEQKFFSVFKSGFRYKFIIYTIIISSY